MDTPLVPLLLGGASLAEPHAEVARHARLRFHGQRGRRDPQDRIGVLLDRAGHTRSVPLAIVHARDVVGLQREVVEAFGCVLIGDHHLV